MLFPCELPDADIRHLTGWLLPAEVDALLHVLREAVPWEVHRIRLFGRWVDSPRMSCWMGDPQAQYRYSGTNFQPHPWPVSLLPLLERLQDTCATGFNSVLANRYRDGHDSMGGTATTSRSWASGR